MKMQLNVLGVRSFNDTVEGVKHDFTKLVVVLDMPDRPNMLGQNAVEMNYGTHENFAQFKDLKFPQVMELDVNMTTKGYELLGAKAIAAARPAAVAG